MTLEQCVNEGRCRYPLELELEKKITVVLTQEVATLREALANKDEGLIGELQNIAALIIQGGTQFQFDSSWMYPKRLSNKECVSRLKQAFLLTERLIAESNGGEG